MTNLQDLPLKELRSDSQRQLLNAMNRLSGLGLQNHLKLPRIVVCGNTSSGKSSILEALSGIRFPVASTLCTRFATELVLRESSESKATYSIVPSDDAPRDVKIRLENFKGNFELDSVWKVIEDTKVEMGIDNNSKISYDVLRLEVYGPELPELTLIDLPGLVQTSTVERKQIEKLAKRYLEEQNTIILAVVTAKDDKANQGVLRLASACDPSRGRTMGIITKPDQLMNDRALLADFLRLAKNEHPDYRLSRPWNIVRNRLPDEPIESFNRKAVEDQLFKQAPWNELPSTQVGLAALQRSLCERQFNHIIQSLPGVVKTIQEELEKTDKKLADLGEVRTTSAQQRGYLLEISQQYFGFVGAAIAENPLPNDSYEEDETMQITTNIRTLVDAFDDDMRAYGHEHELVKADSPSSEGRRGHERQPVVITKEQWLNDVNRIRQRAVGKALPGLFNYRLVGTLFKRESRKWKNIADEFVRDVCTVTRKFLHGLVHSICPSGSETADLIWRHVIMPAMDDIRADIEKKTTELLTPYTVGVPYATKKRFKASLEEVRDEDANSRPAHSTSSTSGSGAPDTEANSKLLESTRAYYKIAMEDFVDNMATLGIENCVLQKLPTLFSPSVVNKLPDDKIQLLGGESKDTISEREYQQEYRARLVQARTTCRDHVSPEYYTVKQEGNHPTRERDASGHLHEPSHTEAGTETPASSTHRDDPEPTTSEQHVSNGVNAGSPQATSTRGTEQHIPTSSTKPSPPTSNDQSSNGYTPNSTQNRTSGDLEPAISSSQPSLPTPSTQKGRPSTPNPSVEYESTPRSAMQRESSVPFQGFGLFPNPRESPSPSSRLSSRHRPGHRSPNFAAAHATNRPIDSGGSSSPAPSKEQEEEEL